MQLDDLQTRGCNSTESSIVRCPFKSNFSARPPSNRLAGASIG